MRDIVTKLMDLTPESEQFESIVAANTNLDFKALWEALEAHIRETGEIVDRHQKILASLKRDRTKLSRSTAKYPPESDAAASGIQGVGDTSIKITPELLADLRQKAENCQPQNWNVDQDILIRATNDLVAECICGKDAQFIAAADPATVLALVAEIERLTSELQEKQRLIDKICEMKKNRWESAVKAFGIRPTESEAGR